MICATADGAVQVVRVGASVVAVVFAWLTIRQSRAYCAEQRRHQRRDEIRELVTLVTEIATSAAAVGNYATPTIPRLQAQQRELLVLVKYLGEDRRVWRP